MPYVALVTVAVVVLALGGLVARAATWRTRAGGRPRRARPSPPAPAVTRGSPETGTVEIAAELFARARLDDVPYATAGVTACAPRGFSHVPAGPHVVRLETGTNTNEIEEIHITVVPGERVVIGVDRAGSPGVVARGPAPTSFDASYIHYPTWSRGVGLTILARAVRARDPQGA